MKKIVCALLALFMTVALAGCGNSSASKPQNPSANSVSAVMQQQMEQNNAEMRKAPQPVPSDNSSDRKTAAAPSDVDVDLTKLSSTMVYSEVYAMMTAPEDYIGKTVRMKGQFALYQPVDANGQPVPDQIYFACVIADATACCQQGLEFVLAGDYQYPDDYPQPGTDISVVGEFRTYMEGEYRYCHLVNAQFDSSGT